MKKTLIALAVAVSAAISGSAMAWTPNGSGGSVELGGTLTPAGKTTPWSVKVGNTSDLDAKIKEGQSVVTIPLNQPALFLGITTTAGKAGFYGQDGISPQIDYSGAVDLDKFKEGLTQVKIPVKDQDQNDIGYMEANFTAGAIQQWKEKDTGTVKRNSLYAAKSGDAFYGGVGKNSDGVMVSSLVKGGLDELDPEIANTAWDNYTSVSISTADFKGDWHYQGYYGGGIKKGENIKITLNTPAKGGEALKWYASLPVVVSYQ
ncbi:hypothetical protein MTR46_01765 [Escherichia coli]|uniref:F4 family fimbrial subunit n=2 Tax=Escherichia coli TaxID=562 RepID=UPI00164FA4B6|nr:hypothetical protein [Escherichia coli]EFU9515025.1 hypothetical protein [Escherichia coli]EGH1323513.1 hypothetical protein [Escherichia coli]EGH1337126.1 hypothetical protein [Escherichia coli]EGH1420594.1 hypothetical protein [Escherichia coli]EGI3898335.1 hypothetical protein [Escherichia coli]